jgi:methylisocitrate lyase
LAEEAGFQATFVSGAALAAAHLGFPDVGLVTMSEVLAATQSIARACTIPTIADCDTGYGNPLNVRRTVREFEDVGVAAILLEDQVTPKRCGHFRGKQVVAAPEMVQKIRAAIDERRDENLVVIARTDSRATSGLAAAIERAQMYAAAGADVLFVEAPESRAELEEIPERLAAEGKPLMANMVEGGRTPLVTAGDLAAMGYSLVTFSGSAQKVAIYAVREFFQILAVTGSVGDFFPTRMVTLDQRSVLLGLDRFYELEGRYTSTRGDDDPSR